MTDVAIPRRLVRIRAEDLPKKVAQRMLVALARLDTTHLPQGRRSRKTLIDRANLILVAEGWPERFRVDVGVMRRDKEGCVKLWEGTRLMPPRDGARAAQAGAAAMAPAVPVVELARYEELRERSRIDREELDRCKALIAAEPVLRFRQQHGIV